MIGKRHLNCVFTTFAMGLLASVSTTAMAQSAPASAPPQADPPPQQGGLEDIVVTARRISESLQDTPVAVSAFTETAIQNKFATDIRALAGDVPNVVITNVPGFNAASIGIRGQSTGDIILTFEPAVGVVVDDFVLAHVQTQLFDLFDVERIEVLRGPQGTLFGKNTVGGVVNVITKKPEPGFSGEVRLGYSSFNTKDVKAAINIPLADNLYFRAAGSFQESDGYYRLTKNNDVDGFEGVPGRGQRWGGSRYFSARAKLLWEPTDDTNILLTYELLRDRGDSPPSVNETPPGFLIDVVGFPGIQTTGQSPYKTGTTLCEGSATAPTCVGTLDGHRVDVDGVYLRGEHSVDDVGTITVVGGWRRVQSKLPSDYTGENAYLFVSTREDVRKQYSLEARFSSDFSDVLKFTVGGMYWGQKLDANATSFLGFLRFLGDPTALTDPNQSTANYKVDSYAVFGEAEYKVADPFSVFVGARYTKESKDFAVRPQVRRSTIATGFWPEYSDSAKFSKPTMRAGYRWEIAPGINNYFTYSQGYKSGGYNEQAMSATSALPFREETADSFELGFKTETADRKLRVNIAAFYVKYNDLQRDAVVPFIDPITGLPGQETRTTNAGKAHVKGIELEISAAPVVGLTMGASVGWQKAEYDEFSTDVNGDGVNDDASYLKLRNAPKWTASGNVHYEFPPTDWGVVSLNADVNYQAQYESTTLNADYSQGQARTLVGASIGWTDPDERFRVAVFGRNLLDKVYRVSANSVAGLFNFTNYAPPRSFGVEGSVKF
ncbi:TonB-dependent receptor [Novosphingobium resinovorum]|uniref:TonB-dependent receptor n=1 Tax=Novosphingobium resinovorum TaxID=158500 RepID=A0A031JW42_9SPHN|nr:MULTISPECIES: TonB-dependent receptor [Novosphingobium]EZP81155.1 TonB-dependent receptor [Novosphingobium resinovorum]MBF7014899.1 TonB-dependent receptor [Novosphingobium sp. HR1a]WJM24624.1 TonB-dependent receptor [Novosphingobium resinovorum]